jgi:hypothetical protein
MPTLRNDLLAAGALLIAVAGGTLAWLDRPGSVDVPPGRSDPGLYQVTAHAGAEPIVTSDGDTLEPVAAFETRGRVLHLERFKPYRSLSNWMPGLRPSTHDVGLGYGPMTDTANVELFSFRHDGATGGTRYLGWRPRNEAAAARMHQLAPFITNVHVIPADEAVYRQMRRLRVGELVTLRGLLVNVRDAQGRVAVTSITPGDRDCEIVWVTAIDVGRL